MTLYLHKPTKIISLYIPICASGFRAKPLPAEIKKKQWKLYLMDETICSRTMYVNWVRLQNTFLRFILIYKVSFEVSFVCWKPEFGLGAGAKITVILDRCDGGIKHKIFHGVPAATEYLMSPCWHSNCSSLFMFTL